MCVCCDLSDRVVILAAVKYLHNNCSRIAFRSQIKSSWWARAYVIEAVQRRADDVDDDDDEMGVRTADSAPGPVLRLQTIQQTQCVSGI